MAKRLSSSQWISPLSSLLVPRVCDTLWYTITLLSLLSLLLHHLSPSSASPSPQFEGFGDELDEIDDPEPPIQLTDLPPPPSLTQSDSQTHHGPPDIQSQTSDHQPSTPSPKPSNTQTLFDFWDEDEFEGIPIEAPSETTPDDSVSPEVEEASKKDSDSGSDSDSDSGFVFKPSKWVVEIVCGSCLVMFVINYFTGKRENENLALAWASKFATKNSVFDKNFSLLGVGEGDDSPLLLKEGQNVFKFYASGRRFCQGLLATIELKSRHDLISRIYNALVPCKDEISFEVYMNDEAMDQVVFAVAKKKMAKTMDFLLGWCLTFRNLLGWCLLRMIGSGFLKIWLLFRSLRGYWRFDHRSRA